MEENRSYDHFFGFYGSGNGLTGNEYNLLNSSNPQSTKYYVNKQAPQENSCDPDHSTPGTTAKIYGMAAAANNDTTNPTMAGFIEWENHRGNANLEFCDVMEMFPPSNVPIITALASEFVLMDRFFAAHPGPTWPNRLYMLSATSAGDTETGIFYENEDLRLYPQKTIFDQIADEGLTWRNYYNDTPWELFLETIANHPENLRHFTDFYDDALKGNLPNFAWINPRAGVNATTKQGSNDEHPDHDVALGEELMKEIYEVLRQSPQWNETLFIVTYDEHGGFYDHVPPPANIPPPGDNIASYPDKDFPFNRLGVRLPTVLISPLLPKGLIVSSPPTAQKPFANSEYSLTSIIATMRILLGMTSGPLTKRDAWSATFEQLFNLTEPRTDCPMTLPKPIPPSKHFTPEKEILLPVNDLQKHAIMYQAYLAGVEFPEHIQQQGQVSEWLQQHFDVYKEKTLKWKNSKDKTPYELLIREKAEITPGFIYHNWNISKASKGAISTISLDGLNHCLDYGKFPRDGSKVKLTLCFPSSDPNFNRDKSQHWVVEEGKIKPQKNQNLCLSNNNEKVYLAKCKDNALNWKYTGEIIQSENFDVLGAVDSTMH